MGINQQGTRCLWLLGPARVDVLKTAQFSSEQSIEDKRPRFRSRRTIGILGYLTAERRPVARDLLVALFWPDEPPSVGRANLSRELHNLAQVLPCCWESDRHKVTFIPSADTFVDIYQLQKLIKLEHWKEANDLLNGEFLEGLYLDNNTEFENWLLVERERWRGYSEEILRRLIEGHTRRGQYTEALQQSQCLLQLSPWNEAAHRNVMRLLALTGQRGAALRQFENCKHFLSEELDVEPTDETVSLYEKILAGKLELPSQLPAFLTDEKARNAYKKSLFVGRESELEQLDVFIDNAIAGHGRVIFISGSPGRGKTALLETFSQRAMEKIPNLLVARGNCNAYSGVGDPYLPYREVMAMLTGDVEAGWDVGAITREHARRLWGALSTVIQVILDYGPHLLDGFVQGEVLLSRSLAVGDENAHWLPRLREHIDQKRTMSKDVEQSYLFQQFSDVLPKLAKKKPLLLILDDFQWADAASISLLFHLGRHLAKTGGRLLIVCAYRPEEVSTGRAGQRHPLAKVLSEFKRTFGDIFIDLDRTEIAENRRFVHALLDAERNRLGESFRDALFDRTGGHPLFTIELLRAMRDRGELLIDSDGAWIAGLTLDWGVLPARVEAVIEERIDRLNPELQEILSIASVEGEIFTTRVLAEVRKVPERYILGRLSRDLERRHRLVMEQEEIYTGYNRMSRYRFNHILFQDYLYKRLGRGERRLLHGAIATAQEKLYQGQIDEMSVQLAHHYYLADDYVHAFQYFCVAGERAVRLYESREAIKHFTKAIKLAETIHPEKLSLAKLHHGRALAYERLGDFRLASRDLTTTLKFANDARDQNLEWRANIDLGKLWAFRDYTQAREYFESAMEIARRIGEPIQIGVSLNWMGNWYTNEANPKLAVQHHIEALHIFERLENPWELANTLDLLGLAHLLTGDISASLPYFNRSIDIYRQIDDRPRLASSLIGRANTVSALVYLASAAAIPSANAVDDYNEALSIAEQIDLASEKAWGYYSLGLLHIVHGHFGHAHTVLNKGHSIATEIKHREMLVGNRFARGLLLIELFALDQAKEELESTLALAEDLCSQTWIDFVSGALATVYLILSEYEAAEACLNNVISSDSPMNTLGRRYCWVRKAELALIQDDPTLSLDITNRLIASAPGMSHQRVIPYLWKMKGEALAAHGEKENARLHFQAAIESAQANGEKFVIWRIHLNIGRLLQSMGNNEASKKEFLLAQSLIDELATTIFDKTLKNKFYQGSSNLLPIPT